MKILLGKDIREADLYTICHEPVASIELMERAAVSLCEEIMSLAGDAREYLVFAGKGNNGGDGLAVARLLYRRFGGSRNVIAVCTYPPESMSEDCRTNFGRLPSGVSTLFLEDGKLMQDGHCAVAESLCSRNTIIIDAVLGTGVSGPVHGPAAGAAAIMNSLSGSCLGVISVDMPSGLPTEPASNAPGLSEGASAIVRADMTLTIEFPKLSLLLPQTGMYAGKLHTVRINLDRSFIESRESPYETIDGNLVSSMALPRPEFGHKGSFGHALVIAGSSRYPGASMLCTGAALRSGCGLVSTLVPAFSAAAMLAVNPSAIILQHDRPCIAEVPDTLSGYSSIVAGPGIGQAPETRAALRTLLLRVADNRNIRSLVLDADALNIISSDPALFRLIPPGTVMTPHPGELARLLRAALDCGFLDNEDALATPCSMAGDIPWHGDMHKIRLVMQLCRKTSSVMTVKGAHTMVCSPDGKCFFNMSGNPGMAKGGSGDVLAGLIAGLAARGHDPLSAAILGVWHHGVAGDMAARKRGQESMNASDILECIRI